MIDSQGIGIRVRDGSLLGALPLSPGRMEEVMTLTIIVGAIVLAIIGVMGFQNTPVRDDRPLSSVDFPLNSLALTAGIGVLGAIIVLVFVWILLSEVPL